MEFIPIPKLSLLHDQVPLFSYCGYRDRAQLASFCVMSAFPPRPPRRTPFTFLSISISPSLLEMDKKVSIAALDSFLTNPLTIWHNMT